MSIWYDYLRVLKVLNCMEKSEWHRVLAVDTWGCPAEFELIWEKIREHGLFHGLCSLDEKNLDLIFEYANYKKNNR